MAKQAPPPGLTPGATAWDEFTLHRLSPDGRVWETWHARLGTAHGAIEVTRGDRYLLTKAGWGSVGRSPTDDAPATDDEIREAVCARVRTLLEWPI